MDMLSYINMRTIEEIKAELAFRERCADSVFEEKKKLFASMKKRVDGKPLLGYAEKEAEYHRLSTRFCDLAAQIKELHLEMRRVRGALRMVELRALRNALQKAQDQKGTDECSKES